MWAGVHNRANLARKKTMAGNIRRKVGITMANTNKKVTVTLDLEKPTKNTVLFAEKVESALAPEKLGRIYIPKVTLAEIGYAEGKRVQIELSVVD